MGTRGVDESKAKGGLARSQALTPERRQEIARKAAQSRWALSAAEESADKPLRPSTVPRRRAVVKKLKGISSVKQLTVSSTLSATRPGCKTTSITENGHVLRTFVGLAEFVDERVQGYFAALQDLGIELLAHLQETSEEAVQHPSLPPLMETRGTPGA